MRITLISTWYPSAKAPGSGIFVQKDAELLATKHDVHVVHLVPPQADDGQRELIKDGVRITRIPMSTRNPIDILRAAHKLREHVRDADVLHTQAISTLFPLFFRRVRVPWVHTEHWSALSNPASLSRPAQLAVSLISQLLRRPTVVSAVCEYLAAPIRAVRQKTTVIVPCIVDPPGQIVDAPRDIENPRIVAVGGLVDRKDPICALNALTILRSSGFNATLTWVGDGPLREKLESLAAELGITDAVTFTGVLSPEGVEAELKAADMFLLPTLAENFCVSAAEAIVHGRPVVVGSNGGQRDYVTPANGEVVSTQTAAAYAQAVRRVWESCPSALAVAATIGTSFSAETVLNGYEEAYAIAAKRQG